VSERSGAIRRLRHHRPPRAQGVAYCVCEA
jgi:hypothetical protein